MGARMSVEACQADYGVTLTCNSTPGVQWGDFTRGQFPPDPDIAGIGIVAVFLAVTSLALIIGYFNVAWQLYKSLVKKGGSVWQFHEGKPLEERTNPSVSDILETIVISCSDQQLFTGGAYALTVRYFKGCSVSAYHYNILTSGLLITCATHLVAVTVVMNYWRYPLMACLRIAITVLVFLVTGLLLAKRTGTDNGAFPLAVPPNEDFSRGSPLFMRAACFETDIGNTGLTRAVKNQVKQLRTTDQAWALYVIMLLWWALAVVAEMLRFLRRGTRKTAGRRRKLVHRVRSWATGARGDGDVTRKRLAAAFRIIFNTLFSLYLILGLAIGTIVVAMSAVYIQDLRKWVDKSGWLQVNDARVNPENEVTTFGQLVPILMAALTVFAFVQMVSEKIADARQKRRRYEDMMSKQDSMSQGNFSPEGKKNGVSYFERPVDPTPLSEGGGRSPWGTPSLGGPTPASTFVIGSAETSNDRITPAVTNTRPGLETFPKRQH